MRPADLPTVAHFQQLPCGTRAKYIGGHCRCLPCRAANSRYETERAAARKRGDWNGLVSAADVCRHLHWLSRHGVGRRAVSAASDVSASTLQMIRAGKRTQLRARAARRILAVDLACCSDHTLVDAAPTWRRIHRLCREGYPKRRLAHLLGYRNGALQFGRRQVTAQNAQRVEQFYTTVLAEETADHGD